MDTDSCYKIGWIVRPHGLKGEVTLSLEDDAPADLAALDAVFLEQNNQLVPYFIEAVSAQGAKAYVKFEDVDTIDDASRISKQSVYIEKSKRPASASNDVYGEEIVGFAVSDEQAGQLGSITQIVQAGPNRLLEVTTPAGKEILIPVNGPFIIDVNDAERLVKVNLPDGFLEI